MVSVVTFLIGYRFRELFNAMDINPGGKKSIEFFYKTVLRDLFYYICTTKFAVVGLTDTAEKPRWRNW